VTYNTIKAQLDAKRRQRGKLKLIVCWSLTSRVMSAVAGEEECLDLSLFACWSSYQAEL
jgi:hypothetical protein